ncbi:hypothetical protein [Anaeromyxobacter terrae]|uniref:hypothetical protein n=1 Tax=Anaeromyxobacter terrae TaxID=2925406 RepID=UPI001F573405|nr:hypothetical protein [Anaeromyxobacter sp. SG22]
MFRRLLPLAAAALAACGGGAITNDPQPPAPPGEKNLAPLATGARWSYRVTDPLLDAPFEKTVEVVGPQQVPGSTESAVLVVDTEPTQEERGWLVEKDGFVLRAREEDRKAGLLVRTTTWSPSAPKTLSASAPVGSVYEATVLEHEEHADGTFTEKNQTYRFTVIAKDVQVTVPAGTFTCLQVARVRLDKVGSDRTYWLAPNVGKVREEGERTEELVQYTPAP